MTETKEQTPSPAEKQTGEPTSKKEQDLPPGWTVTNVGTLNQDDYLVTFDGRSDVDGGPPGPGCAFHIGSLDNLSDFIQHKGKLPVGHKLNPDPDK